MFLDHAGLFGPDPVGDKIPMVPGFIIIRAFVANEVTSRKLSG